MSKYTSVNNLKSYQKLRIVFKDDDKGANKSNYLSKFSINGNYLLIFNEKLYSFKIDFNQNQAQQISDFHKDEELLDIIFIDPGNVFLKYSTYYVKYNILNNTSSLINLVKIINGNEFPLDKITSQYFNDKLSLKVGDQEYYLGIFATESGELYISRNIQEEDGYFKVCCELVKQFDESIRKVYFKKYTSQSETFMGKEYIVLIVVTRSSGYLIQIKMHNDDNNIEYFFENLKKQNKWINLFRYEENEEIYFNIQFDSNFSFPCSFVVLRENFEIDYYEFSKELEIGREIISIYNKLDFQKDLRNSILSDKNDKSLKNNEIIGVHHFDSIIYLCLKTKVYIYNIKNNKIMDFWVFETEPIKDLYIYDYKSKEKKPYYYLVFLTTRNVYFSKIEKNFEDQGFQIKKTVITNFDEKKARGSLSNLTINGKISCYFPGCNNDCEKRCSACKLAYYCCEDHQEQDWDNHRKNCNYGGEPNINDEIIDKIEKIEYKSNKYGERRKEILTFIKDDKCVKNLNKAVDMAYFIIEENRKELLRVNSNAKKNLKNSNIEKDELFYENLISICKMFEDYICNILFLIYIISLKKNKSETHRILNKLVKEMEEKLEYYRFLDLIIEYIKSLLENPLSKKYEQIEDLFVRSIKIITTIAKLFYKLGEFSQYEINLVKCIERIENAYSNSSSNFVLAYTYFIIGNLYIEIDYIGKAILLYNACFALISENPRETGFIKELYIMVNYNLGVLYYITDQYMLSKNKLETLIKFNKDEESDQIALFYETLGEIELEYKNFQVSHNYLQKSLEIRSKLNIVDIKKKKRINILLDNLMQYIDNDNNRKNNTKNIVLNPSEKGMGKTDKDSEEILNYMKILNEEKQDYQNNESKSKQNKDFDVNEMEKFFLFMSKLTPQQINVLNDTQGNINNPNIIKLPIVFSADFKNLLSLNQRLEICNMKLMSLKRNKVLKDPMNRIEIENLNYEALSSRSFQNNLSNIKNYFVVNKIRKNSETPNNLNGLHMNSLINNRPSHFSVNNNNNARTNRNTIVNFMNSPKQSSKKIEGLNQINLNQTKIQNDSKVKKEKFNTEFFSFKDALVRYTEKNPSARLTIDDDELLRIFKDLEKEDLKTIIDNPAIFFSFLEEDNDDSSDNRKEEKKNINKSYINYNQKIQEVEEEDDNDNERNKRHNELNVSNANAYSNNSLNPTDSKVSLLNDNSRSIYKIESNRHLKSVISDNDLNY